jgi:hypothetical protein
MFFHHHEAVFPVFTSLMSTSAMGGSRDAVTTITRAGDTGPITSIMVEGIPFSPEVVMSEIFSAVPAESRSQIEAMSLYGWSCLPMDLKAVVGDGQRFFLVEFIYRTLHCTISPVAPYAVLGALAYDPFSHSTVHSVSQIFSTSSQGDGVIYTGFPGGRLGPYMGAVSVFTADWLQLTAALFAARTGQLDRWNAARAAGGVTRMAPIDHIELRPYKAGDEVELRGVFDVGEMGSIISIDHFNDTINIHWHSAKYSRDVFKPYTRTYNFSDFAMFRPLFYTVNMTRRGRVQRVMSLPFAGPDPTLGPAWAC